MELDTLHRDVEAICMKMAMVHASETGEILRFGVGDMMVLPVFKSCNDAWEYISNCLPEGSSWEAAEAEGTENILNILESSDGFCDYMVIQPPVCSESYMEVIPIDCVVSYLDEAL